ncbi:MAG: isoprenylcysteine carboxylmethyltransferase family protein [Rhodanobacteraceae bacterium]|nr:MAG: isoprenylcysteine carboxylmethyltransferase family protein [Rhodanobacteraceae bacterium]
MTALRVIATVVLVVWLTADNAVVQRRHSGRAENRDRYSGAVLMLGSLAALALAFWLAFAYPDTLRPTVPFQIAGLVLMAAGIALRATAIAQLGRFHTPNVAVVSGHTVVERGLYRSIRHPSYAGALVAFLGLGLGLGNWLGLVMLMTLMLAAYLVRIHEEEAALLAGLGPPYADYCRRTHRLLPGIY